MEKAKASLELSQEESDQVSSLDFPPLRAGAGGEFSFYEFHALRGIRVDRVESDRVFCTFKVPPRLTDREGKLAPGAIANLVDAVGAGCVNIGGHPVNVSVDLSISFLSSAKIDDREGKLAPGAIANLVDAVGVGCVNVGGHPVNVSVDMSISISFKCED